MTADQRENLFWIDYIRAIAALGVVFVHTASDVITEWGKIPTDWWWAANGIDSLTRGCVPMFIMVSGSLLLGRQESYEDFFRKRFHRIFIPFVVWTALYLVWKKVFYIPDLQWPQAWGMVANSSVCFHLWFFYVLIGLYLLTPVLRVLVAGASRKDLLYFLIVWFAAGSLLPFLENFFGLYQRNFHVNLPVDLATGFIGYYVLGYCLRMFAPESWARPAFAVWTVCFLICLLGTGLLTQQTGNFQQTIYDNLSPNIVFYCAAFFVLVKTVIPALERRMAPSVKSGVIALSQASLGIYLIHPMILDILEHGRLGFGVKILSGHPVFMIPAVALGVYGVSFILIWGILQIPYVKRIV